MLKSSFVYCVFKNYNEIGHCLCRWMTSSTHVYTLLCDLWSMQRPHWMLGGKSYRKLSVCTLFWGTRFGGCLKNYFMLRFCTSVALYLKFKWNFFSVNFVLKNCNLMRKKNIFLHWLRLYYSDILLELDSIVASLLKRRKHTVFILINAPSLISTPPLFWGRKGGKIPPKLALGQENILFFFQILSF